MKWIIYAVLGVVGVLGIVWAVNTVAQGRNAQEMHKLQAQVQALQAEKDTAAKAQAEADAQCRAAKEASAQAHDEAVQADARARAKGARVAELEATLAAMGTQAPATRPEDLPGTTRELAAAFGAQGFPPTVLPEPASLAFTPLQSQPLLALVVDGKAYPGALERIGVLQQDVAALHEQQEATQQARQKEGKALDDQKAATAHAEAAEAAAGAQLVACEGQRVIEKKEAEVQRKDEARKGWIKGGLGLGLGILLGLLL